jgi:hypothetical protein
MLYGAAKVSNDRSVTTMCYNPTRIELISKSPYLKTLIASSWVKLEVIMSMPTQEMIKLLLVDLKRSKHLATQCLQLQIGEDPVEFCTTHQHILNRLVTLHFKGKEIEKVKRIID